MIDPQDIASPVTRRPGELEDLGLIGCVVRVAGEVVMTAAGAAVMGHPAASVAWLANQLAAEEEGLRAGQLVFSGGVTAPVPVVAGGSVTFQLRWAGGHRGGRRLTSLGRGTVLRSKELACGGTGWLAVVNARYPQACESSVMAMKEGHHGP